MTIFIGDSESLRMQHRDQSRLRGLISIALAQIFRVFAAAQPLASIRNRICFIIGWYCRQ
jgi:hypothetical protein